MHVHLLVPDLLRKELLAPEAIGYAPSPAHAARLAAPDLPSAELLLARGRRKPLSVTLYGWLADRYGLPEGALTAATSLLGDGGAPGADTWLRADPVQLTVDRDALVLADAAVFTLTAEEATALAQTVSAHFAPDLQFVITAPLRWYARTTDTPNLRWTSVREARGQAIRDKLPQGAEAMRWNAIANEVQMLLHEHPVNAAREARGEPLVNSLWFWGSGRLSPPQKRAFGHLYANDPVARGLAMAAGGSGSALPSSAEEWLSSHVTGAGSGLVLFVLDGLSAPAAYADRDQWGEQVAHLERDWLAPMLKALRSGHIGMLTLALPITKGEKAGAAGVEVEVVRGDLRRFWRKRRALTHFA